MFVSISPLDEVATVCPFLMREIMEKGGNSMLARQVRVAPSSLVVAFLLVSRSNVKSENDYNFDYEYTRVQYSYLRNTEYQCIPWQV